MKNNENGKWKIGTNVQRYLESFVKACQKYSIQKFDCHELKQVPNKTRIVYGEHEVYISGSDPSYSQFVRVLDYLGIITHDRGDYYRVIIDANEDVYAQISSFFAAKFMDMNKDELEVDNEVKFYNSLFEEVAVILNLIEDESDRDYSKYYRDLANEISKFGDAVDVVKRYLNIVNYEYKRAKPAEVYRIGEHIKGESPEDVIDVNTYNYGNFLVNGGSPLNNIRIPIYQRRYVWTTKIYENFIQKLIDAFHDGNEISIGMITLSRDEKTDKNKIVDGQQRMTSLHIFLRALYNYGIDNGYEVPSEVEDLFDIDHKDFIINKFTHIKGNDDFVAFSNLMKSTNKPDSRLQQTAVYQNYGRAIALIEKNVSSESEYKDLTINFLSRVILVVAKYLKEDDTEIFERMNTTSIKLNKFDLLKNRLIKNLDTKIIDNHEVKIQNLFESCINDTISKLNKSNDASEKNIEDFILAFNRLFGAYDDDNDQLDVFMEVVNTFGYGQINTMEKFEKVLAEIKFHIEMFVTLRSYDRLVESNEFRYYRDLLATFTSRTVYTPILMYICKNFVYAGQDKLKSVDIDEVNRARRILFELEKYEIKLQVANQKGQSLSTVMNRVLDEIRKGDVNTFDGRDMRLILTNSSIMSKSVVMIPHSLFISTLRTKGVSDKMPVIIFRRIEQLLDFNGSIELVKNYEIQLHNKPTYEHIIPQTPTKWLDQLESSSDRAKFKENHELYVNFLGNALILDQSKNSKVSNAIYSEKYDQYINKDPLLKKSNLFVGIESDKFPLMPMPIKGFTFDHVLKRNEQIVNIIEEYMN